MFGRLMAASAVGAVLLIATSPPATAEPDPSEPVAAGPAAAQSSPPLDPTLVPSAAPVHRVTPDGWSLRVSGANETLAPVAPLTTAVTSREYVVGGTFSGTADGSGDTALTGGSLEAGFRIGCGAMLDNVDLVGGVGVVPEIGFGSSLVPGLAFPTVAGTVKIHLKPGVVNVVSVAKKEFKGNGGRINIADFRIKIDGCAGQSFIQSFATLSSSTDDTEDVMTYLGAVKVV